MRERCREIAREHQRIGVGLEAVDVQLAPRREITSRIAREPRESIGVGGARRREIALGAADLAEVAARRDPSAAVRVAAVAALKGLADARVVEIWKEISRDDPDQEVRYTAERLLYQHAQAQGGSPGGARR